MIRGLPGEVPIEAAADLRDDRGMQTVTHSHTNRLERPVDDRLIAGVAAGVADYFSISTLAVRLGFIALALVGAGIPLYAISWLVLPSSGEAQSPAADFLARADTRGKQAAAIVIGFLAWPLSSAIRR